MMPEKQQEAEDDVQSNRYQPEGHTMEYSEQGLRLTESFEGFASKAYRDSGGRWTIGYGTTQGVHEGMTCTQEQAQGWLLRDVAAAVQGVNHLTKIPLSQNEFDALVDFTYNVGLGNFAGSTLLKRVNEGNKGAASIEFLHWDKVHGKVIEGLTRRREAEMKLFLGETE